MAPTPDPRYLLSPAGQTNGPSNRIKEKFKLAGAIEADANNRNTSLSSDDNQVIGSQVSITR